MSAGRQDRWHSQRHPYGDKHPLSKAHHGPQSHRFPSYLASALVLVTIACIGFALMPWSPLIGGASFALAVSVAAFTTLVNCVSLSCARAIAVTSKAVGVTVNVPFVGLAAMIAFIGLTQGTDTSVRENIYFAISGIGFLAIGVTTCTALLASQRAYLRVIVTMAYVAN
jgi:hypothetical protein